MNVRSCPVCNGARLRKESLHIRIDGKNIYEYTTVSVRELLSVFEALTLSAQEEFIASRVKKEIIERLGFLVDVGLDYLSLSRTAATLSGGEGQRIRLATQIGSRLMGVLYILDEPSIGLHQKDNQKLLKTLMNLRDLGNTVLVVEHDEETIRAADYVIDMGPGAGVSGGRIVFAGTPDEILTDEKSLTGKYLSGRVAIPVPAERRKSKGHPLGRRRPGEQPQVDHRRTFRWASSPASPAYPARANRPSSSIRCSSPSTRPSTGQRKRPASTTRSPV